MVKKKFLIIMAKATPIIITATLLSMMGSGVITYSPVADADGPYYGWVGETIIFDGSGSYDPSGTIINYTWEFGDGSKGYGEITTHVYSHPGTYIVTLTVLSSAYEIDSDSTYAYIYSHNLLPVADADGPYSANVGQTINFDGCNSYDPDGYITSYSWDFGDGYHGTGPTPTHAYSSAGTYVVTLTVTDNDGAMDSDSTYAYIGGNLPPVADADGPYAGVVGELISFDASNSYDPDGHITGYRWDWTNDGTWDTAWLSSPRVNYSYSSSGTYTAKLQVKDNNGLTDTDTTTVTISSANHPPLKPYRPNGPTVGNTWATYTYTAYTTDPDGDKVRYCFDWGDGSTTWTPFYNSGETASASHSWSYQGGYSIRVKAEDEHGVQSSWSDPLPVTMPVTFSTTIEKGGLYIFGIKVLDTPTPIIIGKTTIEPVVENKNPEQQLDIAVEYYIDGILQYTAYSSPYSWVIQGPLFGSHTLTIIVHDNEGGYGVSDSLKANFFII